MQALSYEEIRGIVVGILLHEIRSEYEPSQWEHLRLAVHHEFLRRAGYHGHTSQAPRNSGNDELVRDVFWDLFRQGAITLGMDNANTQWPFFRLSYSGKAILQSGEPWRFHDASSYLVNVTREVPDISEVAKNYLSEAIANYYSDCLLSSTVMLGVASEAEFLRLLKAASVNPRYSAKFGKATKERQVSGQIKEFLKAFEAIRGDFPTKSIEDLDTKFSAIQSILRVARNEAGHPSAIRPDRENVYVNLRLFIPFAKQAAILRHDFESSLS